MYLEFPANLSSNNHGKLSPFLFSFHMLDFEQTGQKIPDMKFLNYMPQNKNLKKGQFNYTNRTKEIEARYNNLMNEIISEFLNEEKKPLNILPKKSNMDLKRAMSKKIARLNKRTEIAIVELLSIVKQNNH